MTSDDEDSSLQQQKAEKLGLGARKFVAPPVLKSTRKTKLSTKRNSKAER
jgi:hypothetical protein